jgi:hypothetical protein
MGTLFSRIEIALIAGVGQSNLGASLECRRRPAGYHHWAPSPTRPGAGKSKSVGGDAYGVAPAAHIGSGEVAQAV